MFKLPVEAAAKFQWVRRLARDDERVAVSLADPQLVAFACRMLQRLPPYSFSPYHTRLGSVASLVG
jgi:hypothetical protein